MKSEQEIRDEIANVTKHNAHVLDEKADAFSNIIRYVMQNTAIDRLDALHWVLGETYKPPFKR